MPTPSETPTVWPLRHIPVPRQASVSIVVGILVAYLALVCFWQLLFARDPEMWFPAAPWLWRATDGLINTTLTANLTNQLILIVGLLIGVFRFRPSELGLEPGKLPAAVGLTTLLWAANQIVLVIVLAVINKPIELNPEWTASSWTQAAGPWLGQLFGNTLSNNVSPLIKEPFAGPGLGGGLIMLGTLLAVVFGPCAVQFWRRWAS